MNDHTRAKGWGRAMSMSAALRALPRSTAWLALAILLACSGGPSTPGTPAGSAGAPGSGSAPGGPPPAPRDAGAAAPVQDAAAATPPPTSTSDAAPAPGKPAPDAASAVDTPPTAEPTPPGMGACAVDPRRIHADIAHLASAELRGRKPGDRGNELAVQFAERQFTAAGLAPAGEQGGFRQAFEFRPGAITHNVLGMLKGSDPALASEVILVGAHIDHLGVNQDGAINYGADDNGSGAAVVMELARLFKLCDVRPKRTVVFVEWNAEEMGLIGSRHYVEKPLFPLERTIAVYNFDMVGAGDGSGILLFGGTDPRNAWLTELMRGAASEAKLTHVIQTVPQKLASDHAPFVNKGIPICWGFARPDPHPGYHTPRDTIANVRMDSLRAVGELFWAALRPLAMGEEGRFTRRPAAASFPAEAPLPLLPAFTPCDHGPASDRHPLPR